MRKGLPPEGGELAAVIKRQNRRLRMLEMPTGEQLFRAFDQVKQLILDLPGMVTAFLSGGFTTGSMHATGNVTVDGQGTITGPFRNQYAYNTEITYSRLAAWVGNDGRLGWASSSRSRKANIQPAELDVDAILAIEPVLFNYRAELDKHTEDPTYVVAEEFGAIAEDVHDLGLGVVVDYDDEGNPRGINYVMVGLLAIAAAKGLKTRIDAIEQRLTAAGL